MQVICIFLICTFFKLQILTILVSLTELMLLIFISTRTLTGIPDQIKDTIIMSVTKKILLT